MKQAIDSLSGRRLYGQRMATVEPMFANLRHNIEKLAHHGFAQQEQGKVSRKAAQ